MTISLDGYGRYSEYGRTNFKWAEVSNNLELLTEYAEKIDNFQLIVHSVLSVYSLAGMIDLLQYCDRRKIEVYINEVNQPHLNIGILPDDYIYQFHRDIYRNIRFKKENNQKSFENFLNYIDNAFDFKDKNFFRDRFRHINKIQDRNRNTDFCDVYPDLKDWYKPRKLSIQLIAKIVNRI